MLVWALAVGPLIGLASVGYVRAIAWADEIKPRRWLALAAPVAVFAALGGMAVWFPQLLGNGKSLVQEVFSNQVAPGLVALLFGFKLLAIVGCLGSGAPGGLFTPTMACGSLLGSCLGSLWARWWPGVPPASFALLGAGAMLAAAMQAPLSAIVMVLELTHRLDSGMVPLMLVVAGASSSPVYSSVVRSTRCASLRAAPAPDSLPWGMSRLSLPSEGRNRHHLAFRGKVTQNHRLLETALLTIRTSSGTATLAVLAIQVLIMSYCEPCS